MNSTIGMAMVKKRQKQHCSTKHFFNVANLHKCYKMHYRIDAFHASKDLWIMSSYTQKYIWVLDSYAHFTMPTFGQAVMQMYRVYKCVEDWRQQQSSALVKRRQQSSTTPLLFPVSHIAFMLQRLTTKLPTWYIHIMACLQVGITTHYLCSHENHL